MTRAVVLVAFLVATVFMFCPTWADVVPAASVCPDCRTVRSADEFCPRCGRLVGTAPRVLQQVRAAVSSWPDHAAQAKVRPADIKRIRERHRVL